MTVQQQILRLLREVSASGGSAAIFISHDIAVVSQLCSRVLVMYAGRIVEELDVATLVAGPAHPYTAALVASVPTMDSDRAQPLASIPGRAPGPFDDVAGLPVRATLPARDRPLPQGDAAARAALADASRRVLASARASGTGRSRTSARRDDARGSAL